ncbi:MAG: hypothetical protein HY695_30280 [Deltaproteobacteria bacterium]|nr:hypothetical protein [Deltaproteobacteria bacterium]
MYATRIRAHRNRSPQPVSAGRAPWYERPSDGSMLPEQFFGPASLATVSPEAALMCAVLEDALLCFQRKFETGRRCIPRTAKEAENWFFSDDSRRLFSFVSICAVLGLEPEAVRQRLKHRNQSRLDTP